MYIAQNKRKENIAEYILYLWQLEDLLRALQFSPQAIYTTLVKPRGLERAQEEDLMEWYGDLCGLLRREDKLEHGHLDHTMHLVEDMHNFHLQLMKAAAGRRYRELYAAAAPQMAPLRAALGNDGMTDTELAMRALYAVMLHRMKGDAEARQGFINDVLEVISPVIAELASFYRQAEQGEVDLYKTE